MVDCFAQGCYTFAHCIFGCYTFGSQNFGSFNFWTLHLREVTPSGSYTFGQFHLRNITPSEVKRSDVSPSGHSSGHIATSKNYTFHSF